MLLKEKITERFNELIDSSEHIRVFNSGIGIRINTFDFSEWSIKALNLLQISMGNNSIHYIRFKTIIDSGRYDVKELSIAKGIFIAAFDDYKRGLISYSLENSVTSDVFGDLILLSKKCLEEGYKDSSAVLACAALEDCLKKYAKQNGINIENKDMANVINALKANRLIEGTQCKILEPMPKIRDYAMHANWQKIQSVTVNSIIGFVQQFILEHFK